MMIAKIVLVSGAWGVALGLWTIGALGALRSAGSPQVVQIANDVESLREDVERLEQIVSEHSASVEQEQLQYVVVLPAESADVLRAMEEARLKDIRIREHGQRRLAAQETDHGL